MRHSDVDRQRRVDDRHRGRDLRHAGRQHRVRRRAGESPYVQSARRYYSFTHYVNITRATRCAWRRRPPRLVDAGRPLPAPIRRSMPRAAGRSCSSSASSPTAARPSAWSSACSTSSAPPGARERAARHEDLPCRARAAAGAADQGRRHRAMDSRCRRSAGARAATRCTSSRAITATAPRSLDRRRRPLSLRDDSAAVDPGLAAAVARGLWYYTRVRALLATPSLRTSSIITAGPRAVAGVCGGAAHR